MKSPQVAKTRQIRSIPHAVPSTPRLKLKLSISPRYKLQVTIAFGEPVIRTSTRSLGREQA